MSLEEQQAVVKIGKETFSIIEIPLSSTALVQDQKKLLLGAVDLPALVDDLGRVGNFIRIAYNGVAGFTDLQISIREIGVDVTKLCDKSAVTVSKFKTASGSILEDLQGTYRFLMDGLEDIALVTLAAVADVAKDMASAAGELQKEFSDEADKVEDTLKKTMITKGSEHERKKELEKTAQGLMISKEKAKQDRENAEEDFKLFKEKYNQAEAKQESLESSASNPFKAIANGFVAPFTFGKKVFDTDSDQRRAQEAREEKLKHLEEMKSQREARSKALQDFAEFSTRIENCKDDAGLAQVAIDALHQAMGGLQNLSAVMMKAALFWKQMQVHCGILAKDKMKKIIEAGMKRPPADRLSVWTAVGFKKQAIEYYGRWVALDDVCGIYMRRIQETQKDLYGYLTENPTLQQARKNVRQLAATFAKDLAAAQKAITDKEVEDNEMIKQLQEEISQDKSED